ncbi:hypothetical protein [Amycolatopsis sp. lyj-112]|uniref:LppU/SCO3897 family protein n=1 Tax=Amycolatopsis sp. lyj-112 TaxID=2789288 RepID=UPI00397B278E
MTYPQQPPPPVWPQYPVPPRKKSPNVGLIVGIAAGALIAAGGVTAATWAIVTSGDTGSDTGGDAGKAPAVDPDPFSAQAGDCISADENAGSNGEFSGSAIRVHCSDGSANYTVIAQLTSATGADCNSVPGYEYGNPVVYDFESGMSRELCVMPKAS